MTATPDLEQTRHLATELPGPRSRELAERQKRAVPAGVATTMPVYAARAAGGILEDVDGNRLIDLASGIAVTSVGASHPRVVAAVQEQVAQFTHTSFMITPYEGYVAVAEQLDRTSPIPGETRTALFNSGAEAVENAVKVARAYTGKQAVAAFDHAYHGRTTLTMALTAKSMPYKHSFGPFAPEIYRVPGSYPLRDGLSGAEAAQRAISALEKQIGADNLAAVIMEPIQGEGGFIVPAEGFLPAVVEWCKANDVLFIADEVQSGIARTGAWFASETEGIEPDLMATAKGIAGGMPLSGVTGRAEVMDSVHPGGLGGTYGGNPVATAAALAVFEAVEEDGLLEKARRIEQVIREHFAQNADDRIAEVRGRGAMMAIEFVDPATGEPDATLTATVAAAVRAAGVILLTCGTYGNVVRFLPPLTIGEDLLKEGLSEVTKALQSALAPAPGGPTTTAPHPCPGCGAVRLSAEDSDVVLVRGAAFVLHGLEAPGLLGGEDPADPRAAELVLRDQPDAVLQQGLLQTQTLVHPQVGQPLLEAAQLLLLEAGRGGQGADTDLGESAAGARHVEGNRGGVHQTFSILQFSTGIRSMMAAPRLKGQGRASLEPAVRHARR